jgi:hypothetical protein
MVEVNQKKIWAVRLLVAALAVTGTAAMAQAPAATQETKTIVTMPQTPLLPASFADWQLDGQACNECFAPEAQAADVFKEDGLIRASRQSYKNAKSGQAMQLEGYQFVDATGAYSAFTYLRNPAMKGAAPAKSGTMILSGKSGEFLVINGPTVVKATVNKVTPTTADDLHNMAVWLPKIGGTKALSPLLPTYLPEKGLEADSVRYALGPAGYAAMGGVVPADMVGFQKAAETVTAKYAGQGTLTLFLYPHTADRR